MNTVTSKIYEALEPVSKAILLLQSRNPADKRIGDLEATRDLKLANTILATTPINQPKLSAKILASMDIPSIATDISKSVLSSTLPPKKRKYLRQATPEVGGNANKKARPTNSPRTTPVVAGTHTTSGNQLIDSETKLDEAIKIEKRNPPRAIELYREVIHSPPTDSYLLHRAKINLGLSISKDHPKEAMTLYRQVINDPTAKPYLREEAEFKLGILDLQSELNQALLDAESNPEKAIELLNRTLASRCMSSKICQPLLKRRGELRQTMFNQRILEFAECLDGHTAVRLLSESRKNHSMPGGMLEGELASLIECTDPIQANVLLKEYINTHDLFSLITIKRPEKIIELLTGLINDPDVSLDHIETVKRAVSTWIVAQDPETGIGFYKQEISKGKREEIRAKLTKLERWVSLTRGY